MLDVVEIVLNLDPSVIGIGRIAVHHLGPATDPGPHDMTIHIERDLPLELIDKSALLRSWPNQAHVPFEDVEELRQLVDAQLADHLAHPSDAHIAILSELRTVLFRVLAHAAKLVDAKILVALTHPVLQKHHGTRALQLDKNGRHQHQGREERDGDQRGQDVHSTLDEGIDGGRQEGAELVLMKVVDLYPSGQGLADLLDVIDGDMSQGTARQETLPLPRQFLIPQICHYGVIADGPKIGFVQQAPLHTSMPSQGQIVAKRQQGIFGGAITATNEVGQPAAEQSHHVRLKQNLPTVRQAKKKENPHQSTIECRDSRDHIGNGTRARIAQEAMQHDPGQQKGYKGTAQGIDPDGIHLIPKLPSPALYGW